MPKDEIEAGITPRYWRDDWEKFIPEDTRVQSIKAVPSGKKLITIGGISLVSKKQAFNTFQNLTIIGGLAGFISTNQLLTYTNGDYKLPPLSSITNQKTREFRPS